MPEIITKPRFDPSLLDEVEEKPQHDRGWAVVLWNDEVNSMEFVIETLIKILNFNLEKAEHHMIEAHKTGRTIVLLTHKELAELRAEQLGSVGLTVSIEKQ